MPSSEDRQSRNEAGNPDSACTRCRERKIRCGRERPHCGNCERDGGATCVYQTPAKRINHLKLLCDSVDRIQDRLKSVESNFARLSSTLSGSTDKGSSSSSSRLPSRDSQETESSDESDDDEQEQSGDYLGLHVFRNQVNLVDHFHGSSSLFVLCNQLRQRMLGSREAQMRNTVIPETLLVVCEAAGEIEPFPIAHDQAPVRLPPKQQVIGAIGHFFQHVDYTTDIFVQDNLLANVERIYSQPLKPQDEAWATCFKAIVLLVLGREISLQSSNALFGDFARDLLPSRAALVNSRLLTSSRLINIQALLLLSVAAQQFDPVGWGELIFTHACMLARTMGLHHTKISALETETVETIERSKVLRALYARDRSLCTTRGRISWLPSDDCNMASQLGPALKIQAPYADRLRLTILQDDVHRLSAAILHGKITSQNKIQAQLQMIESRLDQYAADFSIFESISTPAHALLPLEFLTTRILALQHGAHTRQKEQVRSDARASCILLLTANGDNDPQLGDYFKSLMSQCGSDSAIPSKECTPTNRTDTSFFTTTLDAFSVPAFFVLLNLLLQPGEEEVGSDPSLDIQLLKSVSAVYQTHAGRMQPGNYHCKIALIFGQLLAVTEMLKVRLNSSLTPTTSATEQPIQQMQHLATTKHITNKPNTINNFENCSTTIPPIAPMMASQPTPPSSSFISWDQWLSGPSLAVNTPPSSTMADYPNDICPEFFAQILGSPPGQTNTIDSMQWAQTIGNSPYNSSTHKRRRTHDDTNINGMNMIQGSPGFEEVPFHLIS